MNTSPNAPTKTSLTYAQRALRKKQKAQAIKNGTPPPLHPRSTLESALKFIEWRKQFEPTEEPGIVRRGPWIFESELEKARIDLAEEIIRRTAPGPFEDPNYLALLAYQAASIEMGMGNTPKSSNMNWAGFLLGTIAAPNVNAFASVDIKHGYTIIALHSALIDFIYQAAKCAIAATHPYRSPDGKVLVKAEFSDAKIRAALASDPRPAIRLYRTLEAYYFSGYPRAFANEEVKEEESLPLAILVGLAERFVIAHEYGHKHAEQRGWQALNSSNPLWEKEFFSDAYAMYSTVLSAHHIDHVAPAISLGAGVFSLACLEVLREALAILKEGKIDPDQGDPTHPPTRMRAQDILSGFHREFYIEYLTPDFRDYSLEIRAVTGNNAETSESARANIGSGAVAYANTLFIIWDGVKEFLRRNHEEGRPLHPMWSSSADVPRV